MDPIPSDPCGSCRTRHPLTSRCCTRAPCCLTTSCKGLRVLYEFICRVSLARSSQKGRVMIQATKILNQFVGGPRRPARRAGLTLLILALAALLVFSSGTASAQVLANTGSVSITIVGPIKAITVDTPGDPFSSGTISVGTIPLLVAGGRSGEHTSELQSQSKLVCRPLLLKKKKK